MRSDIPEQIAGAAKSPFEFGLTLWTVLNRNALDATRQLIDLNVRMTNESLAESAAATHRLMSAHDPQELFSLIAEQLWPSIDKAFSYSRQAAEIGADVRAELGQATWEQMSEAKLEAEKLAEGARRVMPAAATNIFGFMQSESDNANAGYAQIAKAAQEISGAAQGSLPTAAQRTANEMKNEDDRGKKK